VVERSSVDAAVTMSEAFVKAVYREWDAVK